MKFEVKTEPDATFVVVVEDDHEVEVFKAAVIKLLPKHTKCELAYHFILDFCDEDSNIQIMELICRDWTLCQRDIFDILPEWERGVFVKEKKCTKL